MTVGEGDPSGDPEVTTPDEEGEDTPSLSHRVVTECERVTRAMAVVDCCLFATESMRISIDRRPDTKSALEAVYDLLYEASGNLELIVDDLPQKPRAVKQEVRSEDV